MCYLDSDNNFYDGSKEIEANKRKIFGEISSYSSIERIKQTEENFLRTYN